MLINADNNPIVTLRGSRIIRQLEAEGLIREIETYLNGAVYANIRNHRGDGYKFTFRDLFGGPNWEWSDTPLSPIWELCLADKNGDEDAAYKFSARVAGFILKNVLIKDRRTFKQDSGYATQSYSWVDGD